MHKRYLPAFHHAIYAAGTGFLFLLKNAGVPAMWYPWKSYSRVCFWLSKYEWPIHLVIVDSMTNLSTFVFQVILSRRLKIFVKIQSFKHFLFCKCFINTKLRTCTLFVAELTITKHVRDIYPGICLPGYVLPVTVVLALNVPLLGRLILCSMELWDDLS